MYDARTKLSDQVVRRSRPAADSDTVVCRQVIPRTVRLSEAPSFGQPITAFDGASAKRDRLPGARTGGERWRAAADWVGASGPSSRTMPAARRALSCVTCRSARSSRTRTNLDATSTRSAWGSLTASVRELGVLQPVLVRETGDDRYELIAGERRWRAAKRARCRRSRPSSRSRATTPRSSRPSSRTSTRRPQPARGGGAYQQLIEDFGLTHDDLSRRVSRAAPRSPTPCGSTSCRRPSSGSSPTASCRPVTPGAARHPRPRLPGGAGPEGREGTSSRCERSRRRSGSDR